MPAPKISVIIPVYNVEEYLPVCLDSVLAQTFSDFEAVCVNDGSPDNSAAILEKYAKKDARIKVVSRPNGGLSAARNTGLENACGEYIYFLDSDDYIHPQLLEILYKEICDDGCDFVSSRFQKVKGKTDSFPSYKDYKTVIVEKPLVELCRNKKLLSVNVWSKLYRRKALGDLQFIPGLIYEDLPFTCACMERCKKGKVIELPLYCYLQRGDSLSGNKEIKLKNCESYIFILRHLSEKFHNSPFEADVTRRFYRPIIKTLLKQKKNPQAEAYIRKELSELLKEKVISWRHFSLRYKIKLWAFLHSL